MSKRGGAQHELSLILKGAEDRLWADFEDAGAFRHRGDIGTGREAAVISFLRARLPGRFGVASGEVVDVGGSRSGQVDIVIFDASSNAPLLTQDGDLVLLGAEALLATVEVKSTLTQDELANAILGIAKIRKMRPWGASWAPSRPRGGKDDRLPRSFSSILAYETNLGSDGWKEKEMTRVRAQCDAAGMPVGHLDRVAVLSEGLLTPGEGLAATHEGDRRVLGMWYSALLNFLARESQRRKPFPWSDYEPRDGRTWTRVLPPVPPEVEPPTFSKSARRRYKSRPLS